jgi:hypothetical protein
MPDGTGADLLKFLFADMPGEMSYRTGLFAGGASSPFGMARAPDIFSGMSSGPTMRVLIFFPPSDMTDYFLCLCNKHYILSTFISSLLAPLFVAQVLARLCPLSSVGSSSVGDKRPYFPVAMSLQHYCLLFLFLHLVCWRHFL